MKMIMDLTWLDNNSWLLTLGPHRLLIDPWLVGDLVFGQQGWLFRGVKLRSPALDLKGIDLILLSQGLADHAHPPTLHTHPPRGPPRRTAVPSASTTCMPST